MICFFSTYNLHGLEFEASIKLYPGNLINLQLSNYIVTDTIQEACSKNVNSELNFLDWITKEASQIIKFYEDPKIYYVPSSVTE